MLQDLRSINTIILSIVLTLAGCARPTSPSGGPRDKTPPRIVQTVPKSGTTNFSKRTIVLHFNEFIERSTLSRALSLSPDLGIEYQLDWGRKSVEIIMNKTLPDSTTFIYSIGTELSDVHGNNLNSPIKIALSTGPKIAKGRLVGTLIRAKTGQRESGLKVLLYEKPVDLSSPADYTTETDTGGHIQFPYLGPGSYKAFWVDDRNRNRKWDQNKERAQPFPKEFVQLGQNETDTLGTLFVHTPDTSRSRLVGVGLFTRHRLRFRFSEPIEIDSLEEIHLYDSTMSSYGKIYPLYKPEKEPYVLFAHSTKPLKSGNRYHVRFEGLTDLRGNPLEAVKNQPFTGTTQQDTVLQRVIDFNAREGIYWNQPVRITYAKPISKSTVTDSLKIIEGETRYKKWPEIQVKQNTLIIPPDTVWQEGARYSFSVWQPGPQQYKTLKPTIWHAEDLGKIHLVRADTTDSTQNKLKLAGPEKHIIRHASFVQSTTISRLPPVRYRIRVFQDRNNSGSWNSGTVAPFVPPERYFIRSSVPVRPGFTSDMIISYPY